MNLSKKLLTFYTKNAYNILKDKNKSFMWGNASVTPLFFTFIIIYVPNLRFPEFNDNWQNTAINTLLSFKNGVNADATKYGKGIKYISVGDILNNTFINYDKIKGLVDIDENTLQNYSVTYGDILFQRSSEVPEDIGQSNVYLDKNKTATFGGFVIRGKKIGKYNPLFFNYMLKCSSARKSIIRLGAGAQHYNIGQENLNTLSFYFPSSNEQEKIADLFSKIDERITTQIKIIEDIKSLQMSIINRFILSRKANPNNDYYYVGLSNLLEENNEKKGKRDIEICSVSVSKGVINQLEYLGKSYASENTNNYNVVNPNDIIYTKSPTGEFPFGIVKQNKTEQIVAVSPLYGVYKPKSKEIGNLLHHYFMNKTNTKNYLCNLIQKGAKNTILISNQRFLENSIYIPSCKDIIMKISNSLDILDEKCKCEEKILKSLIDQKKYLLNNLFI